MPYIKEYTRLHPKEQRQLFFKRRYKADHPAWDDSMVRLTDLLKQQAWDKSPRLLDIGCGHGNFVVDELGNIFEKKVGFDIDQASTSGNTSMDELVHGQPEALPLADGTFDLVISLWVLEHVSDPQALFAEVARVLKPGGLFCFVTPNRRSALIMLRRLLSKRTADFLLQKLYGRNDEDVFDVHYQANTVKALAKQLKNARLDVQYLQENSDPSYTSFGPVSYRLSALASRLPFSFFRPHLIGVCRKQG